MPTTILRSCERRISREHVADRCVGVLHRWKWCWCRVCRFIAEPHHIKGCKRKRTRLHVLLCCADQNLKHTESAELHFSLLQMQMISREIWKYNQEWKFSTESQLQFCCCCWSRLTCMSWFENTEISVWSFQESHGIFFFSLSFSLTVNRCSLLLNKALMWKPDA